MPLLPNYKSKHNVPLKDKRILRILYLVRTINYTCLNDGQGSYLYD